MVLKLFYSPLSPPCRAVWLTLKAINLEVSSKEVDLLSKEYISEIPKVNPQHTVPTLVDNDFTIWDSHAIAVYLVEKYSPDTELYPNNPQIRSIINQRLHFDSGILYPHVYNSLVPILFRGKKSMTVTQAAGIKQAYRYLEEFLKRNEWLAGKHLTIADLCCIPAISTLDYVLEIKKSVTPNLQDYLLRCQELPYYDECNQNDLSRLGALIQERITRGSR